MRQVPLAVQLITYISDSCSREPFATEVAEKLCFEHVARGHNPEPKPNTSGDGQKNLSLIRVAGTRWTLLTLLHCLHRQFVCCDIMEVAQMVGDITSDVPWGKTHKTLTPCKAEFEQ